MRSRKRVTLLCCMILIGLAVGVCLGDTQSQLDRARTAWQAREYASALLESNAANLPVWNEWDRGKSLRQAADVYFDAKNYSKAAELYALLAESRSSPKEDRASATCRLAMCKWELKDPDAAVRLMKSVSTDYPDTPAAKEAKAQLYVWSLFGGQSGKSAP